MHINIYIQTYSASTCIQQFDRNSLVIPVNLFICRSTLVTELCINFILYQILGIVLILLPRAVFTQHHCTCLYAHIHNTYIFTHDALDWVCTRRLLQLISGNFSSGVVHCIHADETSIKTRVGQFSELLFISHSQILEHFIYAVYKNIFHENFRTLCKY